MARSQADLLAIKSELTNNPNGLPYLPFTADNDAVNAHEMNEVRGTIDIERDRVPNQEIAQVIDLNEWKSAQAAERQWIQLVLTAESLDTRTNSEVREGMLTIFGAGSDTRTNLQGLLTEPGNRIEEMFQAGLLEVGGTVTPSDVANARNA